MGETQIHMKFIGLAGIALSCVVQAASPVRAEYDEASGRVTIIDAEKPVLTYSYKTVPIPPELANGAVPPDKYAVPRSNYIHPLNGLDGVALTSDWNRDHPHHRGIYWAWPEVVYKGETGDLHALQRVWARPTGRIETRSGDGWAEVEAENRWMWEDKTPIVRETVTIRAWHADAHGRWIDLALRIEAIEDGVTLARRDTNHYGGLNIRLAAIREMKLAHHADPDGAAPRMAWQSAAGIWPGSTEPSSVTVFEKTSNPGYPADYVEYPDLPWFQPTFPRAGTRHALVKTSPLVLRYRFWIRAGHSPDEKELRDQWHIYQKSEPS
jgi:Methane oxygenase PmoA